MTGGDVNAHWARILLDEMARCGVREICVAPGSRSTPLVLAAAWDSRFRVTSVVDERSAGFLALGMGKATGVPAVVVTTSGTAGANVLPAVIEASQGEVPLLVLTADRPHRLRDSDANQTMDQHRLFGTFPRMFAEVAPPGLTDGALKHLRALGCRGVAAARGPFPGPVHLNLPFDKPLEPSTSGPPPHGAPDGVSRLAWEGREGGVPFVRVPLSRSEVGEEEVDHLLGLLAASGRGVMVAGPTPDPGRVGSAVLSLAAATGFPLLADPLSGARFGDGGGAHVVAGYDLFLRAPGVRRALAPELILRVGASPTSSALLQYLEDHADVPQVVVDAGHRWKDHTASAHDYLRTDPAGLLEALAARTSPPPRGEWRALWAGVEARTAERLRALMALMADSLLEGDIARRLVEAMPEGGNLLVGNSMPIRDVDAFTPPGNKGLKVFGNRGTSGIDGLVSTTLGIGAVSQGRTVGLLGDLALFHDMNGLLTLKKERYPVGFVVVNNDGGGIFQTLPVRTQEPAFTEYFSTPHGLDFGEVARVYDIPFRRVEGGGAFSEAFDQLLGQGGPFILEVRTSRTGAHEARKKLVEEIVADFQEDEVA